MYRAKRRAWRSLHRIKSYIEALPERFLTRDAPPFQDNIQLASFDLFDTVFVRVTAQAEDIHELVGDALQRKGAVNCSANAWRQNRIGAEQDVRIMKGGREVTLAEIYDTLSERLDLSVSSAARAMDLEIQTELQNLRPVAATLDRIADYRLLGTRIAFVSDTYLPREVIEDALRWHGVTASDDLLLISSEYGVQKHDGKLFEHLVRMSGVRRECIAHTGDNRHSDVAVPNRMGFRASLFRDGVPTRYEALALARRGPRLIKSLVAGCSRAVRLSRRFESDHDHVIWSVSADVAGPLLVGYVLWTLLEAQERGLKTLFFLARDGQILKRIAEVLVKSLGIPVAPKYLYASRQALFLPALDPQDPDFTEIFGRLISGRSLAEAALSLDLSEEALLRDLPDSFALFRSGQHRFDLHSAEQLAEHIKGSTLADYQSSVSSERRRAMMTYFASQGVFDQANIGIVDLGWRGNLQLLMAKAFRLATTDTRQITGFYLGLVERPEASGVHRVFIDENYTFNAALLEVFCAADHGSTWRYDQAGNNHRGVVLVSETNRAALDWGLKIQQDAIVAFTQTLADTIALAGLDLHQATAVLRSIGASTFMEFKRNPTPSEAEVYGVFLHADNVTHDNYREIGPPASLSSALVSVLPGAKPKISWPQATLVRSFSRVRLSVLGRDILFLRGAAARILQAAGRLRFHGHLFCQFVGSASTMLMMSA